MGLAKDEIRRGIETAFIDCSEKSMGEYRPRLITNNYEEGRKVLSSIEEELLACEEFSISVAFLTESGITPLLQTLKLLEERGVPGKILTTDYLVFSEPKAMDKLHTLKNIHIKMYNTMKGKKEEGFHTKGYIFRSKDIYRIVVGSSNMTLRALTCNKEWNTKIVSTDQGIQHHFLTFFL